MRRIQPFRPRFPVLAVLLILLPAHGWTATETFDLANGDKVSGEVVARTADEIVIEHPALGRITVPVESLAPPPDPTPGLFGTRLLRGWTKAFDLGISGSQGNTDENAVRLGLRLRELTDDRRWKVNGAYKISTTDGHRLPRLR